GPIWPPTSPVIHLVAEADETTLAAKTAPNNNAQNRMSDPSVPRPLAQNLKGCGLSCGSTLIAKFLNFNLNAAEILKSFEVPSCLPPVCGRRRLEPAQHL